MHRSIKCLTAAAVVCYIGAGLPSHAAEPLDRFKGEVPETFKTETELVDAFKARMSAGDQAGVARLLGLDLAEVQKSHEFDARFESLRQATQERVLVKEYGADERELVLGRLVWSFPFPIVRDGVAWKFDTSIGLEEISLRRIGENELETIYNCRAYLFAQAEYASEDRDGDGVFEFAQNLKSSEGTQDGLYWPEQEWEEQSPLAPFIIEAKAVEASSGSTGYFGYLYRILRGQGSSIVGGNYDYVINGNMIAGTALVAWPAEYGVTGVKTFVVSHHGTIYEKDLGSETEQAAGQIVRFDLDDGWSVVSE
jgi:hypothetical protein